MKKILIVEDDKFLATAYLVGLEGEGYIVKVAETGQQALDFLNEYQPDLIILDLLLPEIDGFTLLTKLKADQQLKNIRVIIASNLSQSEDIKRGLALGAVDYIVKSESSVTQILTKINSYLKN